MDHSKFFKKVRNQAYKLEFLDELEGIHNTFHVFYLRKFLGDVPDMIPLSELRINEKKELLKSLKQLLTVRRINYDVRWLNYYLCVGNIRQGRTLPGRQKAT